jgi:glycosyltransferase involved in cell wall biosynthesis
MTATERGAGTVPGAGRRPRILYVDTPFEHAPGGDKSRSRLFWPALNAAYDVDLALLSSERLRRGRPAWTRFQPVQTFEPVPVRAGRQHLLPRFSPDDRARFRRLACDGGYSLVCSRYLAAVDLLQDAQAHGQPPPIVLDVDFVGSRLMSLGWAVRRSLRRRWYLFEKWRLRAFERDLFSEPWTFLFSNTSELAEVRNRLGGDPSRFVHLQNAVPELGLPRIDAAPTPTLLYFGCLDSVANVDAYEYLRGEVLPHFADALDAHDVTLRVVGSNPPERWKDELRRRGETRVEIVGPVEAMDRVIAESLAVILPLRIAAGTLTRVLEAAAQERAVITTSVGASGFGLEDALLIGDTPAALARHVRAVLADARLRERLGRELRRSAVERHAPALVSRRLIGLLDAVISRSQDLSHAGRARPG